MKLPTWKPGVDQAGHPVALREIVSFVDPRWGCITLFSIRTQEAGQLAERIGLMRLPYYHQNTARAALGRLGYDIAPQQPINVN